MSTEPEHKWQRVLRHLVEGNTLDRFQAERIGDHALNSTISYIQDMGLRVSRNPIVLQGRFGRIRCKRYFLDAEQREQALKLLGAS